MASNIILQKQDLSKHCHELKASIENQAELLKSVQTISGKAPWDITVTQKVHLVYSDHGDGSVNIV